DRALAPLDDTDARDDAGGRSVAVVELPRRESAELEERCARVDEPVDPLACEQLAARAVPLDGAFAAAGRDESGALAQLGDERCHPVSAPFALLHVNILTAMCFDLDSLPPVPVIAGAAISHEDLELEAADGTSFAAFHASPDGGGDVGIVVLPDVRGLYRFYEELALRFAERGYRAVAIDYFGRTAGVAKRGD